MSGQVFKRWSIVILFIFGVFAVLLFIQSRRPGGISNPSLKQRANQTLEFFTTPTQSNLTVGYVEQSSEGLQYNFLAILRSVVEESGSIYATIQYGSNPQNSQKVLLIDKNGLNIFTLNRQKGYDFYPTTNILVAEKLTKENIVQSLSRLTGRTLHFSSTLKVPTSIPLTDDTINKVLDTLKRHIDCNNAFYSLLISQEVEGVSCTPLIDQAYAVQE